MMHHQSNAPSVYIGHLESHHVALVGDEADNLLNTPEGKAIVQSLPEPSTTQAKVLINTLRCQTEQGFYLAPKPDNETLQPHLKQSQELLNITLKFGDNLCELQLDQSPSTHSTMYQWSGNLSDWSYDDAELAKDTDVAITLKVGEQKITLCNAPYLFSAAALSHNQRNQLFAHLDVYLNLCCYPATGTWVLDVFGGDATTTHYTFAGWHNKDYQQTMLEHWYEKIAHKICINEPPEVKGSHA